MANLLILNSQNTSDFTDLPANQKSLPCEEVYYLNISKSIISLWLKLLSFSKRNRRCLVNLNKVY